MSDYAVNQSWDAYFYKYSDYLDLVPTWEKILKDAFSLVLLLASIYFPRRKILDFSPNINLQRYYLSFILLFFLSLSNLFASRDVTNLTLFTIVAVIRPFLITASLLFFCHKHLNFFYFRIILECVNIIGIIQVYHSFLQRNSAIINNGLDWLHSGSARSVGTFADPNTLGRFLALLIMVNLFMLPPNIIRFFLIISYGIALFFTGSRASLLIIGIFILLFVAIKLSRQSIASTRAKNLTFAFLLTVPLLQFLLLRINLISNRADDTASPLQDGRYHILFNLINRLNPYEFIFGNYLGYGSNALILTGYDGSNFLSDSTPASLIGQFGITGLLLFILIVINLFKQTPRHININNSQDYLVLTGDLLQSRNALSFYLIISCFTTIIFESYAVIPILLGLIFYDNLDLKNIKF
ncbi:MULTISPECIES: hypothetical protein [unclassified Synechocystis]|nr:MULTISPECIES: hypothetical protein [unclassified Synechocystis]UOO12031.1 hypothetical protein MT986_01835 [Synechocystis sp. PCC 6803]